MALANYRVRAFASIVKLEEFITTDGDISAVIAIFAGRSGGFVLVYDIT